MSALPSSYHATAHSTAHPTAHLIPNLSAHSPQALAAGEAALHFPLDARTPNQGEKLEVAPGVYWLRLPLPFALNHINLWLLRDEMNGQVGWTLVDCGADTAASREHWQALLAEALEGLPLLRIIVTHMHPDHIGLAHWLCSQVMPAHDEPALWMSLSDYALARLLCKGDTEGDTVGSNAGGEGAARHFAQHGLQDEAALAQVRARGNYYPSLVPAVPNRYRRLMAGDTVNIGGHVWHIIVGYGHAPEHLSLYAPQRQLLVLGDMVLPRISTNVSVFDVEPEGDPLRLYLQSLEAYAQCAPETLVLPAHGRPFQGLAIRIAQLQAHHQDRLAETLAACRAQACSAWDIVPILFKRALDMHQLTFAMGEAIAHLHTLWYAGQVQRVRGEDGVYRFQADEVL